MNDNVWKVHKGNHYYALKRYPCDQTFKKVKKVHHALHAVQFPHILPMHSNTKQKAIFQPWIEDGGPVHYEKYEDRSIALRALKSLHETNKLIPWENEWTLQAYPYKKKLTERLQRFKRMLVHCTPFISEKMMKDFVIYGEIALQKILNNEDRNKSGTILHGDVAHHNFLRNQDGQIILIDFDLASFGNDEVELALWAHRVLPSIQYNIIRLLHDHHELQYLNKLFFNIILYPNEVFREWLTFLTLPPSLQKKYLNQMMSFTEIAHAHWPKLWYTISRL